MKCPLDGHELRQHSLGVGAFHECPHCHGLYFRREHLLGVATHHQRAHSPTAETPAVVPIHNQQRLKNCPSCKLHMQVRRLHQVEADVCLACQSVWLDPGEIQQIVAQHVAKPSAIPRARGGSVAGDIADGLFWNVDVLIDLGSLIMDGLKETPELAAEVGGALLEFVGSILDGL